MIRAEGPPIPPFPGQDAPVPDSYSAAPHVSRFPVVSPDDLPPDLQKRYAAVEEKSGFLPNVFAALSWRPEEAGAFFAMHDALMDKESLGLSRAERELIVVATSAAGSSPPRRYCSRYSWKFVWKPVATGMPSAFAAFTADRPSGLSVAT